MEKKERLTVTEVDEKGVTTEISIRKIENGYIKRLNKYGDIGDGDDKRWFNEETEEFVEELPENFANLIESTPKSLADNF